MLGYLCFQSAHCARIFIACTHSTRIPIMLGYPYRKNTFSTRLPTRYAHRAAVITFKKFLHQLSLSIIAPHDLVPGAPCWKLPFGLGAVPSCTKRILILHTDHIFSSLVQSSRWSVMAETASETRRSRRCSVSSLPGKPKPRELRRYV